MISSLPSTLFHFFFFLFPFFYFSPHFRTTHSYSFILFYITLSLSNFFFIYNPLNVFHNFSARKYSLRGVVNYDCNNVCCLGGSQTQLSLKQNSIKKNSPHVYLKKNNCNYFSFSFIFYFNMNELSMWFLICFCGWYMIYIVILMHMYTRNKCHQWFVFKTNTTIMLVYFLWTNFAYR